MQERAATTYLAIPLYHLQVGGKGLNIVQDNNEITITSIILLTSVIYLSGTIQFLGLTFIINGDGNN